MADHFLRILHTTNELNQVNGALQLPICQANATFCGKPLGTLLPQPAFEVIHKSYHNLTKIFRN